MDTGRPRYHLTFEALPSTVPVAARVKGLLKRALRSFGLKCIAAVELPRDNGAGAGTAAGDFETGEEQR
jgi:hypothetical protein